MIDLGALASSTPDDVATYLASRGWASVYRDRGGSEWLRPDNKSGPELWLPNSSRMKTYLSRVIELVDTLAEYEVRSPAAIAFDLTHSLEDIQRLRMLPDGRSGTVDLTDGSVALEGIRKWVLSGATNVALPERVAVQPSRKPAVVDNYMRQVRLAAPEEGSFVWKIATPVVPSDGEQRLPFNETANDPVFAGFNRRATFELQRATSAALRASTEVAEGGALLDTFTAAVPSGVSSNLCLALAGVAGNSRYPVEISFQWAAHLPAPPTETVRFGPGELEIVREAGQELRRVEPERDVQVQGYVTRLVRESDQRTGEITLAGTAVGDSVERFGHYSVELVDADYREAVRAHGDSLMISVGGDVVRTGNRRWIERVRGFRVLPPDQGDD